ncbi:hypothetical protein A6E05_05125 [Aliivibrio sp. 1S165]|uniref:hypothetical protein n=1 Tax=unclassified Aliivibrio TaxID=2645654 RepID=UPI00080EA3C4|nr:MULTISPECIES: hypothetical protein [unclassified Aliivibrio]OCH13689.1 hypothetical protein A6E05_05125 [Aliivibrio sp. 1S165]OCH31668.1 hypothetical protein A6E06_03310 [Aliivibrio sp. 1S175]
MKKINLLLSIAGISLLSACGGSDSGGSSNNDSSVPSSVSVANGIRTSELSAPEGFAFSTEREVTFNLSVANSQSERGFMSIYTEFNEGVVDYTSQIIVTPMNDQTVFESIITLPNHVDKVWIEVWYPSAIGSKISSSVDIVDNNVSAVL